MKSINVKNTGYAQMLSWNAMIAVRTAHKHMSTCCYPNILCFMTLPLSLLISAFGQTLQLENSLVWKIFWYASIPLFPYVFSDTSVYTNIDRESSIWSPRRPPAVLVQHQVFADSGKIDYKLGTQVTIGCSMTLHNKRKNISERWNTGTQIETKCDCYL